MKLLVHFASRKASAATSSQQQQNLGLNCIFRTVNNRFDGCQASQQPLPPYTCLPSREMWSTGTSTTASRINPGCTGFFPLSTLLIYAPSAPPPAVIFEFLWPTVTIPDIILAIRSFDFYNIRYSQRNGVPASVIVFITLANIWRSHFRTVFDRTPFTTAAVLASIRLDISKRIDEDHVHTLL
ncbi:hypothetical protein HMPREF1544_04869 [Mucor circinelloides 1006PhL]|uniref:Uncharacterized protein n=1 Tax=Mucor circinelloides f. circinelloides (strain 1006PhL) TaxID=1220926 RepID=S2K7P6_MUCC1|nr:hypothetical protein HMPREF1544_04869 [Mucor circinelloides 1006PhL]